MINQTAENSLDPKYIQQERDGLFMAGHNYWRQAHETYGHYIYGEHEGRLAVAVSLLLRHTAMLAGPPGGAKSTLAKNAYKIFTDVDAEDVALVPTASSLKDYALVGGAVESDNQDGQRERKQVYGIFRPGIKFGWLDEINRVSSFALNSILDLPESRGVKTVGGGFLELPGYMGSVSTLNPTDEEDGTFHLSKAITARHLAGAISGNDYTKEEKRLVRLQKDPDGLSVPFTSSEALASLGNRLAEVGIEPAVEADLDSIEIKMRNYLKERYGLQEGLRLTKYLGAVTMAVTMMNKGNVDSINPANPEDSSNGRKVVNQAARLVLATRVGARASSNDLVAEFEEGYQKIAA